MKKFNQLKVHNTFAVALILFWFVDLVITIVKMFIGHSTMIPVDRKLLYLNGMLDFLWIFGISIEFTLKNASQKLYDSYLKLLDCVGILINHDAITATTEKPEGLEEGVALKAE